MQRACITLIFIFILKFSHAQNTFQKLLGNETIPGWGRGIIQTPDKGLICIGTTNFNMAGSWDVYLVKTDAQGDTLWTRTYGSNLREGGGALIQTKDGAYMLCGYTGIPDTTDILLIKVDQHGDTLWTRSYNLSREDIGTGLVQTFDGGYLLVGNTLGMSNGGNICLIRIDSTGKVQWAETFGSDFSNTYDHATTVIQTRDSGFFISGNSNSFGPAGPYFLKIDASGKVLWTYTFSNINISSCNSAIQTSDGGFMMAGMTTINHNKDAALMKIDSNGRPEWVRSYGIDQFSDEACSVEETADGYALTGYTSLNFGSTTNALLIKTDKSGNMQWSRHYGSAAYERGLVIVRPADSGYVMYGESDGFGNSARKIYLVRTDDKGESGCNNSSVTLKERSHDSSLFDTQSQPQPVSIAVGRPHEKPGHETAFRTLCQNVSVQPATKTSVFQLYPNPVSGFTTMHYYGVTDINIYLYNTAGKLVYTQKIAANSETLVDLRQVPGGIYILQGKNAGILETVKIFVAH